MREALKRRITERLTCLSNVLQYLHNGEYVDSSLGLQKLSNENLVNTIIRFTNSEDPSTDLEENGNEEVVNESLSVNVPFTLKERLLYAIEEAASGVTEKRVSKRDLRKVIKREIAVFEDGGCRGPILDAVYNSLLTIKSTSVDSENFRMLELYALKCAAN
ncbi:hypothetical protein Bhyg_03368 [Pseudolycoriella hygida]|uniref:Uncharacterized protein n=1 Tax=Pseudolycoriella hygida TaxID=35572 RepID=A0A9Q0S7F8_9DIPT|nr:hypothetical protein Bhyg_03368 [Pseudolycoriella hygida]